MVEIIISDWIAIGVIGIYVVAWIYANMKNRARDEVQSMNQEITFREIMRVQWKEFQFTAIDRLGLYIQRGFIWIYFLFDFKETELRKPNQMDLTRLPDNLNDLDPGIDRDRFIRYGMKHRYSKKVLEQLWGKSLGSI